MFFKNDDFGDKSFITSILLTVGAILLLATILGIIIPTIEVETFELTETFIQPQIVQLQYVEETSSLVPVRVGKTTTYVRRNQPEKFLVTVSYEDITETFDSKTLYQAAENGEEIQLILVQKFYKETGELEKEWLKLVEEKACAE